MYCIKCGVELANTEKQCPLCRTVVYHPELTQKESPATYPPYEKPKANINKHGVLFLITMLYTMLIIQLFVCELSIFHTLNWSLYASGALLLSYVIIILPTWFRRPNPVIFVPCDFAAVALYLLFIDLHTKGGWFLSFAFPTVMTMALIVTAVITLSRYIKRGYFFIFGGASILVGLYVVIIETLLIMTFHLTPFYFWSVYPLIGFILLGIALIVIGICRPLRESLAKKFFL